LNKLTIILCIIFSIIFLTVGIFVGIQIQQKDSIETSEESNDKAEEKQSSKEDSDDKVEEKQSSKKDSVNDLNKEMEKLAIGTFNAKFEVYISESVSGAKVRSLVSSVKSSNAIEPEHQITIEPSDISTKIVASKKYLVKAEYGNDGYINKISITEK